MRWRVYRIPHRVHVYVYAEGGTIAYQHATMAIQDQAPQRHQITQSDTVVNGQVVVGLTLQNLKIEQPEHQNNNEHEGHYGEILEPAFKIRNIVQV